MNTRSVMHVIESIPTSDGAGVKLRRSWTPAPSDVGTDSMTRTKVRVLISSLHWKHFS